MNIYLDNGYLDIAKIIGTGIPYNFCIGGRGIGKTYGAEKYLIENHKKFILLRRTQSQADIISKPAFSVFKSVCDDLGIMHSLKPLGKYQTAVWFGDEEEPSGYICALSTFSNIRGFDASDIEYLIYDEFIPERHERAIRNEASAFFNVCETIGRNRELKGRTPLTVLCLANSNDIANPIFIDLKIVNNVSKMMAKGNNCYTDKNRGLAVYLCNNSPISEAKSDTSLYRLTKGTEFSQMAVENEFVANKFLGGESRSLREYKPLLTIGEITVYKHKSRNNYYISPVCIGSPLRRYDIIDADIRRFKQMESYLFGAYVTRQVEFESPTMEVLFLKYFGNY